MSQTSTYTVNGMTCAPCVASVQEEVAELAGVSNVKVDLASGRLVVTAVGSIDDGAIQAAVEEAGYQLEGMRGTP